MYRSLLFLFAGVSYVLAQQTCNVTSQCGPDNPCCSEFGFCGSGQFCLGGCNPLASHSLDSCKPEPACESAVYTFNPDTIVNKTSFFGNASTAAWTLDSGSFEQTPQGDIALILTETNNGTRLSSTRYVHYGTITTRLKTSNSAGVVTAFITMSDSKDEIDWEFPGTPGKEGQTNFYWLGVPDYTHGAVVNATSDVTENFHNYTIQWTPDSLSWLIDNVNVRTVTRQSTVDSGVAKYPSTPSRIQLSIWPAGIPSSPQGTVQWSGGLINWKDPDYISAGNQFSAIIHSVTVQCAADTPAGTVSYTYGANVSGVPGITNSNLTTVIPDSAMMVRFSLAALVTSLLIAVGLAIAF